jgi:dihydroorotase
VPLIARQFWGAIFEPNLAVPITTAEQGLAYRVEILTASREYPKFEPFVLAYLTDSVDPEALERSLRDGIFIGAKFYPRGATTNSDSGIANVQMLYTPGAPQYDALCAIASAGKVLQLHCELNYDFEGYELDPYDKEPYFFEEVLPRIIDAHPDLKISCEHLTCSEGADFLLHHGGPTLGCSITPHHLLYDRRDMFRGGLRPHLFCLPVIKAEENREALFELVLRGLPFVYAGTDSAPHDRRKKESDCCSGGVFSSHAPVELYAQAFELAGSSPESPAFEKFLSINGPAFYDLAPSERRITLRQEPWTVDELLNYSLDPQDIIRPLGYEQDPEERAILEWRAETE